MRLLLLLLLNVAASAQITQYAFPQGGAGGSVSYDSTRSVVWYAVESVTGVCKVGAGGSPNVCVNSPANNSTGGLTYSASDDRVYQVLQNVAGSDEIVQFNPNTNTFTATWVIPDGAAGTAFIIPFNGSLYYGETSLNKICTVSLTGTFGSCFNVGTFPHGASIGPNGSLRFVLFNGNQIGQITTGGVYTAVTLPQSASHPGVTTPCTYQGSAGICFTINSYNQIGFMPDSNQSTGGVVTFNVPTASADVWGIAQGSDGNVYFGERAGNKIGMVTMATGRIVEEWALPNGGLSPNKICLGFGNFMVFTEHVTNNVDALNVTPAGGKTSISTGSFSGSIQ